MAVDKSMADAVAEQLERLREDYLARLPEELSILVTLASSLDGSEIDYTHLDELHHRLHKLAGSGGTFGFAALGDRARMLEQRVKKWLTAPRATPDSQARQSFVMEVTALTGTLTKLSPSQTNAVQSSRAVDSSNPTRLVWLIEDDVNLAAKLTRQLESFGYAVRHFLQISDAEAAAQTARPDILVMDILFPQQGENATEVLMQRPALRELGCPLLFISSNDDFICRARASRLGAAGYFVKPLDVPCLANRMAQIFDQMRAPPERVLIVDDDVALAAHYRLILLAAGMDASVLHEPQDIIETVSAFRPELILMDLHMPDYTGPELAGVIRQHDRWVGLPIVYLSAETDLDQQIEAMGHGADDFLTKPISDPQLVAAVRARVERARALDAQISKDSLTGLLKHASIKESLEIEVTRARRIGKPVTVSMLDIDHFKSVNDTYGHAVGDVVISAIAMLLRQRLRQSDIVGRYGGEEFVAVLPECDIDDARGLLEDVRKRFAALDFSHDGKVFSCTLSAGMASSTQYPEANGEELLIAADEALYAAKHGGRNQIRAAVLQEIDRV